MEFIPSRTNEDIPTSQNLTWQNLPPTSFPVPPFWTRRGWHRTFPAQIRWVGSLSESARGALIGMIGMTARDPKHMGVEPKIGVVKPPQIIHLFIGFTIIYKPSILGGKIPLFLEASTSSFLGIFGILNQKVKKHWTYVKGTTNRMDPIDAKLLLWISTKEAPQKNRGFTSRAPRRIPVYRKLSDLLTEFMQKGIPIKPCRLGKQGHDYLTTGSGLLPVLWPKSCDPNHVATPHDTRES